MKIFTLIVIMFLVLVLQTSADVGGIITQPLFNEMLKNRNNQQCPGKGFYTYDAFITAARSFPNFGTTGDGATQRKELAAFLGQTSHETNGGAKGDYTWGYCFLSEQSSSDRYKGRGPIQLTGQNNYRLAGESIKKDLISNPDLVATDAVVSLQTAIWFWMTRQDNKPSSHDVITGRWNPSAADRSARRVPDSQDMVSLQT